MRRMLFRYNALASQKRNRGLVHQAGNRECLAGCRRQDSNILVLRGHKLFLREKLTIPEWKGAG